MHGTKQDASYYNEICYHSTPRHVPQKLPSGSNVGNKDRHDKDNEEQNAREQSKESTQSSTTPDSWHHTGK